MRLLTILLLSSSLASNLGGVGSELGCAGGNALIGGCSVTNSGSSISVGGEQTSPGSPGTTSPQTAPISGGGSAGGAPDASHATEDDANAIDCSWSSSQGCPRVLHPEIPYGPAEEEEPPEPAEDEPALPTITIADLVTFAPPGALVVGEPDNVGVADLPANFVGTAETSQTAATLFGFPLSIRFSPVSFTFDYGDGTTQESASGGATWAALGQAQLTPTTTSHVYAERGTYLARVDVHYAAEIDLGGGWFPVQGVVTAAGAAQEFRVFEAHTALVAHTCGERPDAVGC